MEQAVAAAAIFKAARRSIGIILLFGFIVVCLWQVKANQQTAEPFVTTSIAQANRVGSGLAILPSCDYHRETV